MTAIVQFAQNEQLTLDDLNAIGTLSRDTFDNLTADAVDSSLKFAGFPVTSTSTTSVTVGAGRVYQGGQMYSNEDNGGVALPLLNLLPVTAGNTKIVSIVGTCTQADSNSVPRTFLTNAATGVTEADNVATQNVRRANIFTAQGVEAPNPLPPPIASAQCEIARVVLGVTGIVSITYVEANRLQTNTSLDSRATSLEAWRAQTGARINTLASDIANLANSIVGLPSPVIFQQVVNTLSQIQQKAKVPATALNFHFDNFLTYADSASDRTNSAYVATVQEGIRFADNATQLGILALFNPIEPKIQPGTGTGIMLPAFSESPRIDTTGNDGQLSISQYQFQNITSSQQQMSRQVVNFGTSFTVCTNSMWWQSGNYDPITGIFSENGETYQVNYDFNYAGLYNNITGDHNVLRLTQFWTSTMTDTYTAYKTTTVTASGSTLAQTFLNSQAGWLTSVDVYFSQVAATGDVKMLLCATTNGQPDYTQVIANTTVSAANLKTYPAATNFPFAATYLDPGSRYAIVLVTPGNHFVCYVENNKYAQGSLFYSTDGAWSQGDLTKDLAFRANFAKFTSTVCTVQMSSTPFQLAGGITDMSLLYGSKIPDGCQLFWEVQNSGVWYPMQSYATGSTAHPFTNLPDLVPVRVTYVGTTDLMPAIDMTQTQTTVSRKRGDFTHCTPVITIGASSSTIKIEVIVDYFDPLYHTVGCKLTVAGADVSPGTVSTTIDPTRALRRTINYTFALGAPTTSFVLKISGTTTAITNVFHVESRYDYES